MSQLFNMLSRLVITFLPRSKRLLISWLQSPSAVILEPRKIKSDAVSTVFPSICHEVMGPDAMILVFWMLSFKASFSLSSFTLIKRLFISRFILSDMSIATPAFFWPPFAWNIFFQSFSFSLYVSLCLRWVSCRPLIKESCFYIRSGNLCVLVVTLTYLHLR